jgi:hypothetical protein
MTVFSICVTQTKERNDWKGYKSKRASCATITHAESLAGCNDVLRRELMGQVRVNIAGANYAVCDLAHIA